MAELKSGQHRVEQPVNQIEVDRGCQLFRLMSQCSESNCLELFQRGMRNSIKSLVEGRVTTSIKLFCPTLAKVKKIFIFCLLQTQEKKVNPVNVLHFSSTYDRQAQLQSTTVNRLRHSLFRRLKLLSL